MYERTSEAELALQELCLSKVLGSRIRVESSGNSKSKISSSSLKANPSTSNRGENSIFPRHDGKGSLGSGHSPVFQERNVGSAQPQHYSLGKDLSNSNKTSAAITESVITIGRRPQVRKRKPPPQTPSCSSKESRLLASERAIGEFQNSDWHVLKPTHSRWYVQSQQRHNHKHENIRLNLTKLVWSVPSLL